MTLKVKLREVIDAIPAMGQFAQKELPAKAAYRVSKLVRKMMNENRDFQKARGDVVKKHGAAVPGKPDEYRIEPEKQAVARAELDALLDMEVELEGCVKVAWADIENLSLPPAVLTDLEAFIEAPPA